MSHLLLLAFMFSLQVTPERETDPSPLAVQVGLFAYSPEGAIIGSATTGGEIGSFGGSVFTTPTCGFVSSSQVPNQATYAWEIRGEVIERRSADTVVRVDWKRVRQDGQVATLAGSRHAAIRENVPLALDEMIASQVKQCHFARVSLEVRLSPRSPSRGGGRTRAQSPGSAPIPPSGRDGSASVDGANGAAARSPFGPGQASRSHEAAFDVELWLVHESSGMKERTVPIHVQMPSVGGTFAFPSITLTTPRGEVTANVGGGISFAKDASRQETALIVSITRTVRLLLAQPTPIREVANTGSTEIRHPMPGPNDVVAFRMPPIRFADVGLELPDSLSVRLRVRPTR
jgi:hypothetical protein